MLSDYLTTPLLALAIMVTLPPPLASGSNTTPANEKAHYQRLGEPGKSVQPLRLENDGVYTSELIPDASGIVELTFLLFPNAQEDPLTGTMIEFGGTVLAFRSVPDAGRGAYQLIVSEAPGSKKAWDIVSTYAPAELSQASFAPERMLCTLQLTVDYENNRWWLGSKNDQLASRYDLRSSTTRSVSVSNGRKGTTTLITIDAR